MRRYWRRRRYAARRRYRRRRKRFMLKRNVALPLPNFFKTHHRYHETVVNTAITGAIAVGTWSANSIYTVAVSHSGHRPIGYDQMAAFYKEFTVVGSKMSVRMCCTGTSTPVPILAGLSLKASPTAETKADYYIENGNSHFKLMPGSAYRAEDQTLKRKYNNTFIVGKNLVGQVMEPDLTGSTSSDPTLRAYYHLFMQAADKTSTTQAYQQMVVIDYIVVWKNLQSIAESAGP